MPGTKRLTVLAGTVRRFRRLHGYAIRCGPDARFRNIANEIAYFRAFRPSDPAPDWP